MSTRSHRFRPRAYSLVEMLTVLLVLAIVAGVAVSVSDARSTQAEAAARTLAADVAFAQSEAMARPDVGCLLKIAPAENRYWLARPATPDTPIMNPITRQPYEVQLGPPGRGDTSDVALSGYQLGGDTTLQFDAFGSPNQGSDAAIVVTAAGVSYSVVIEAVTGIATVVPGTVGGVTPIDPLPLEEPDSGGEIPPDLQQTVDVSFG